MRVLVTGASGTLGAATARALAARGDRVTVLQRRPAGLGLPEVLADVADAEAVRAGRGRPGRGDPPRRPGRLRRAWPEYARANITGRRPSSPPAGPRASAGWCTCPHRRSPTPGRPWSGWAPARPIPERARGPYARSKAAAEQIALAADGPELAVAAIRPHLVWGPGDQQLVGRIVERARAGRLVLVGTGAALMDSTYTDNAVAALVAAVDRTEAAAGRALVVSNGEPRPVAELLAGICAAAGVPGPRRRVPARPGVRRRHWSPRASVASAEGRAADDQVPGRAAVHRALVRPAGDPRRAGLDPAVSLDEGFDRLAAAFRR